MKKHLIVDIIEKNKEKNNKFKYKIKVRNFQNYEFIVLCYSVLPLQKNDFIFIDRNFLEYKDNIFVYNKEIKKEYLLTVNGILNLLKSVKGIGKKTLEKLEKELEDKIKDKQLNLDEVKKVINESSILNKKQKESFNLNYKEIKNSLKDIDKLKLNIPEINKTLRKYLENKENFQDFIHNPYKLSYKLKGIGFKTIDNIVKKLNKLYMIFNNIELEKERIYGIIFFALKEGEKEGHVFLTLNSIKHYAKENKLNFSDEEFEKALKKLEQENLIKRIKRNNINCYYLIENYEKEVFIAKYVLEKLKYDNCNMKNIEIKINDNINLSEKQKEAIEKSLKNNFVIITGGPGTGKTTVAKYIYKNLLNYYLEEKIKIMAPTGTAAKRIGNKIGCNATTIHRGLKFKGKNFEYNENNKLPADVVIIDEASMIDMSLMYNLMKALKYETKLILIGDKDQLPPVGIGEPFTNLLESNVIETIKLDRIYRQEIDNPLVDFANQVNEGEKISFFKYLKKDFYLNYNFSIINKKSYMKKYNENYTSKIIEDTADAFIELLNEKKIDILDIQILTQMKNYCDKINLYIQNEINPNDFIKNTKYKVGDKVIQIKNNYELGVFNGDIGIITDYNEELEAVKVKFIEGNNDFYEVYYTVSNKKSIHYIENNIELAYAMTIHKSQGNEWNYVLISLNNYYFINRKLLYTAVTRSKNFCHIFTNIPILINAISTPYGVKNINGKLIKINRNTNLKIFLNNKISF